MTLVNFVALTIRAGLIRVTSARERPKMSKGSAAKKLKEIPAFRNEDEERKFWAKADSKEYLYWKVLRLPCFQT